MALSDKLSFDPDLLKLEFKEAPCLLYATIEPELLSNDEVPREFLGFSRLRMASLLSEGKVCQFDLFEVRFQRIWEFMIARQWKRPVRFVIGAGTNIKEGFQISARRDSAQIALLSIVASQEVVAKWNHHCLEFAVRKQMQATGITEKVNAVEIHHALLLAQRLSYSVTSFPLTEALRIVPDLHALPYHVKVDNHTLRIELSLRHPPALRGPNALRDLFREIEEKAREACSLKKASGYFMILRNHLAATIEEALDGPPGIGIEVPVNILAGFVRPCSKAFLSAASLHGEAAAAPIPVTPETLEGAVAWCSQSLAGANAAKTSLPHFAFESQRATVEIALAELVSSRILPGTGSAERGVFATMNFEPFRRCGEKSDPYFAAAIRLGSQAIDAIPVENREIQALTLSMRKAEVLYFKEYLKSLVEKVSKTCRQLSLPHAEVWQLNWQFFPITRPVGKESAPTPSDDRQNDQVQSEKRSLNFLVRELVSLNAFRPDPGWIVNKFYPVFTAEAVRSSLKALEKSGMIQYSKSKNRYLQATRDIKTTEIVEGLAIADYHREMIALALGAISYAPESQRDIVSATLALPINGHRPIRDLVMHGLGELFGVAGRANDPDSLYQLNFQFFPLVSPPGDR